MTSATTQTQPIDLFAGIDGARHDAGFHRTLTFHDTRGREIVMVAPKKWSGAQCREFGGFLAETQNLIEVDDA